MVKKRHKEKSVVLVSLTSGKDAFWRAFFDIAREFEWRVHDINLDKGLLAPGLRPAGAVLSSFADTELVSHLKGMGCKCIRMGNHPHPDDGQMPAVLPDSAAVGRMAIDHFSSRGLKYVAHLVNEPGNVFDQMPAALLQEANRLGLELIQLNKPRTKRVEDVIEDLLKGLPRPIGLIGVPAYMLRTVYLVQQLGWTVPDDLAILSPVESLQCEATTVPLSAIELDFAAQGRQAASILKRMMDGGTVPSQTFVLPKGVVLRQSTDLLAVSDTSVAKALQYIWEYYHWPLSVDDVALEVNVSRSTIQRRFRQYLGRSVNDEIRRKRLEECGKLLRNSSKSLAEIAKLVGLQNRGYLHKAFTKAYGMSPGQYRSK